MIEQPDFVKDDKGNKIYLYNHQLKSVYDMETLERDRCVIYKSNTKTSIYNTNVGFFRDIPGYGKTLSMCVLIARDFRDFGVEWDINKKHEHITYPSTNSLYRRDMYNIVEIEQYDRVDCVLIVCNPNLISQWEKELKKCNLNFYSVVKNNCIDKLKLSDLNDKYHVILISSNFLTEYMIKFGDYAYRKFILDEVTDLKIKNVRSIDRIISNFYWFISATITQNLHIFKGIFSEMIPKCNVLIDIFSVKNSESFIKESIALPLPNIINYYYKENIASILLGDFVPESVKSNLKCGNINQAMIDLGCNGNENIFEAVINRLDKRIELCRAMSPGPNRTLKLTQAIKEREIVENRLKENIESECPICYSTCEKQAITPCCYSVYCSECLLSSLLCQNNKCPLCRLVIDPKKIIYNSLLKDNVNSDKKEEKDLNSLTQIETIIYILKETIKKKDSKILIFSSHDNIINTLSEKIDNLNIKKLKGFKTTREKTLNDFKEGKLKVLYLDSTVNASGLNLQEATDIILYHEMTVEVTEQIIGRAVRVGSKHIVNIHKLYSQ